MPGFFEALKNFEPKERQKPFVTIDGKRIEVSIEKFKEITLHGESEYEVKKGKIVRKPFKGALIESLVLGKTDENGYNFVDRHPYWPNEQIQGGYTWHIKQE
jgi:hypothetical protein